MSLMHAGGWLLCHALLEGDACHALHPLTAMCMLALVSPRKLASRRNIGRDEKRTIQYLLRKVHTTTAFLCYSYNPLMAIVV